MPTIHDRRHSLDDRFIIHTSYRHRCLRSESAFRAAPIDDGSCPTNCGVGLDTRRRPFGSRKSSKDALVGRITGGPLLTHLALLPDKLQHGLRVLDWIVTCLALLDLSPQVPLC